MYFAIFVDQILAQLHDFQFMAVSQCNENLEDFKIYVQRLSIV